ncbi:MAG TPA: deoxyribodipyrimidine photo-lyase, partial [Ferruginibacter sp.]|nr:deoxyribodipyrimidine photo-lyase [Ferruginibacter sp.]
MSKSALPEVTICWFRRDLRLYDHAALYHALLSDNKVLPVFIFDP